MADLSLPVRYYRNRTDPGVACVEANFQYGCQTLQIPASQAALVLVDVWDVHPISSHLDRTNEITRTRIAPALRAARSAGVTVVHAPSPAVAKQYPQWTRYAADADLRPSAESADWPPVEFRRRAGAAAQFARPVEPMIAAWTERLESRRIVPEVEPLADDFVVATGEQLHRLLRDRGILHLIYAGFATNICIPFRDYGMRAMRRRGYNLILLRDCTTAVETHDTVDDLLITRLAIRDFEMVDIAWTATSDDWLQACATA